MRRRELIVLKLGGSVLRDREALGQAVHEVYRWWREGWGVVAVVSALEGETDRLSAEARAIDEEADGAHRDALLATGELRASALLGLALGRAGVCAVALTPQQAGLRIEGRGDDARPVGIDAARIERELARCGVVVIPGFIGVGEEGEVRTLGRGGSDLSAIAVAHALGAARCRLVKDVAGLYTRDPKLPGPRARLLSAITFEDALALDGGIVQHAAVRFARERGMRLEVGGLHAAFATVVGAERTAEAEEEADAPARPLRVAVLGLGTVGLGVYRRLCALPGVFRVTCAVCRNVSRGLSQDVDASVLRAGMGAVELEECDVVVEAIGGEEPAAVIAPALERGVHVVTANKCVVAKHGAALRRIAARSGAELRFAAAAGGAMPIVEAVERMARGPGVSRVDAVLNGTVNAVLNAVSRGATLAEAVADAQRRGLAEADPTRDLQGVDAADKLAVLCGVATGYACALEPERVAREGVGEEVVSRLRAAGACGAVVRQVASLSFVDETVRAEVALRALAADHPQAELPGAINRAVVTGRDGTREVIRAAGAGRWPTAEAVVADCLEIARAVRGSGEGVERVMAERAAGEEALALGGARSNHSASTTPY